eukprot:15465324-Alexandrium_andersonii.AAC.1
MVDAPRAHDQVPRQPRQRRPVRGGGVCHSPTELLCREPQVRAMKARVVGPRRQRPKAPASSTLERLGCLLGLSVAPIAREGDPANVRRRRLRQ